MDDNNGGRNKKLEDAAFWAWLLLGDWLAEKTEKISRYDKIPVETIQACRQDLQEAIDWAKGREEEKS